jgi:predicted RNA binding protein YcfA (HicA-like mRNA interferase family)
MGDDGLLARMLRTEHGWGADDLDRLYVSFGFRKRQGGSHTIYIHDADPMTLRATVARHSTLPIGYIQTAIRLIRLLRTREE